MYVNRSLLYILGMLDENTKEALSFIAFNESAKPKDRVSASKLLLTLGIQIESVCTLLHRFTDDPNFPDGQKVKAIELLDKFEVSKTDVEVEDEAEMRKKILENYNL